MRLSEFRWTLTIFLAFVIIVAIPYIFPGKATFAGSHTMYKVKNTSTHGYAELCIECHGDIVSNITYSAAHDSAVCICHGYNPNTTDSMRNINLTHNLTKNVYCTNCHTRYNETENVGKVLIANVSGTEMWTENQSAHYIYFNRSDPTLVEEVYSRSWRYFNRSFGPLS